jgi:predicted RNA-binding protein Jag
MNVEARQLEWFELVNDSESQLPWGSKRVGGNENHDAMENRKVMNMKKHVPRNYRKSVEDFVESSTQFLGLTATIEATEYRNRYNVTYRSPTGQVLVVLDVTVE